ncbi:hypothetical protein ACFWBS_55925 [Streptomyces mirabilis]|uniref:hypothetical protein n=1 Tax=Streptomyces mirabilis TaxID=68239 RepID=UPI00225B1989|nr:hypothetical protein [Streptomyces mirabilis]MCX4428997.1 hypothetical protein [Streptomyces mirabilis]
MFTLVMLVVLLLFLIALLLAAGVVCLVRRYPVWGAPLGAAFGVLSLMSAVVGMIVAR